MEGIPIKEYKDFFSQNDRTFAESTFGSSSGGSSSVAGVRAGGGGGRSKGIRIPKGAISSNYNSLMTMGSTAVKTPRKNTTKPKSITATESSQRYVYIMDIPLLSLLPLIYIYIFVFVPVFPFFRPTSIENYIRLQTFL